MQNKSVQGVSRSGGSVGVDVKARKAFRACFGKVFHLFEQTFPIEERQIVNVSRV